MKKYTEEIVTGFNYLNTTVFRQYCDGVPYGWHIVANGDTVLTDGESYTAELWLGNSDSPDNWREIAKEEADTMMADDHEVM